MEKEKGTMVNLNYYILKISNLSRKWTSPAVRSRQIYNAY